MERRIIGLLLTLALLLIPLMNGAFAEATPGEASKIVSALISNNSDGVISGKVEIMDDTITVDVSLYDSSDTLVGEQLVKKASPNFAFTGLSDGKYQIRLRKVGEETVLLSMDAEVKKSKTASPIYASALGGTNSITVSVNSASPIVINVKLSKGEKSKTVQISGPGSLTFSGLEKGTYKVECSYDDPTTGVNPCVISDINVIDSTVAIAFTSIVPGEEEITISGTAVPGSSVLVGLMSGTYIDVVTAGTDGVFSTTIGCVAGTYTNVSAQYLGNPDSKVELSGTWVVSESSVVPGLTVDTIYDNDLTVIGVTNPGVIVVMKTYDYTSDGIYADSNGFVKFTLPHTYVAGTEVKFTVYYGTEYKYDYSETKTVVASTTYPELSYGSTGTAVLQLTTRLANLNYPVSATSMYDSNVVTAVRLFQSKNGITVTGVANDTTQKVAYSSAAIAYDSYIYPTLVRGDRGSLVTTLQSRLRELGYYTIKVDGIFGSGTQRAVRNFQARNGLTATGVADSTTQQLLYSSSAIPAGSSGPTYYTTLKRSNRYNSDVVPLQSRLNALGYHAGTVDGYFGSRTYRAVRNFQSRNGLSVTGVADVTTQEVLYSSSAIAAGSGTYYSSTTTTSTSYSYRLLYWGCRGDEVKRLQQALINKGYKQIISVDGIYGQQTYDAVCAFQKAYGLTVDGIAGKKTQNALYGTNY